MVAMIARSLSRRTNRRKKVFVFGPNSELVTYRDVQRTKDGHKEAGFISLKGL